VGYYKIGKRKKFILINMNIDSSIMIVGEIGSGKTTIAQFAAGLSGHTLVGFGDFLKDQFTKPVGRRELQDLGLLLVKTGPENFLQEAIKKTRGESQNLLFDGVRHQIIFNQIKTLSNSTFSIYVEANL
jgi:dephospho-CoA kinase